MTLKNRLTEIVRAVRGMRIAPVAEAARAAVGTPEVRAHGTPRGGLVALGVAAAGAATLVAWPPLHQVADGDVAVRTNRWSGQSEVFAAGPLFSLPGLHTLREIIAPPSASGGFAAAGLLGGTPGHAVQATAQAKGEDE